METGMNILYVLMSFLGMEFMAWFTHKFIMHGPLWFLHEDHHVHPPGFFEKNDSFFLIFAIPSWLLIMFGLMNGADPRFYLGIGIAIYGLAYFLVHDVFIHQRFNLFKRTKNPYLLAIRKAHKVHHKTLGKAGGSCFGMLWVPKKFFKEAQKSQSNVKVKLKEG